MIDIKLVLSFIFFIGSIIIFVVMYPSIKEYRNDSDKMDELIAESEKVDKRTEIFTLKIEQLKVMNRLIYYVSSLFFCIVISLAFLASYFQWKIYSENCEQ